MVAWSSALMPSGEAMHSRMPEETMANPARSRARLTAASWVTTSRQSRPSSMRRMTPPSWPWARRRRLMTGVMSSVLRVTIVTLLSEVGKGGWDGSGGEGCQGGSESFTGVGGDGGEALVAGHGDHDLGVHRLDHGGGVVDGADDDVARQEQPDGRLGLDCGVRERGSAGAEDDLGG